MSESKKDLYEFVESPSSLTYSVRIKKGKYADTVYSYGKVALKEESGVLRMNFEYNVSKSKISKEKLESDEAFKTLIGDVLLDIIDTSLQDGKYKLGNSADKLTLLAKNATESPTNDPPEADQR